jgi:hypothetical protein
VTPDLCHEMHDCPVSAGDAWLSIVVPAITSTRTYAEDALGIPEHLGSAATAPSWVRRSDCDGPLGSRSPAERRLDGVDPIGRHQQSHWPSGLVTAPARVHSPHLSRGSESGGTAMALV